MAERTTVVSPDGAELAVRTVGDRPRVVVVPGSVSDGSDWVRVTDLLGDRFTVHVLTRRGVGASSDGGTYGLEHEYDDIIAVLNATGSRRLVVRSFGAICALGAALRSPALERLALCEPPLNIQEPVVPKDALVEIEEADAEGDVGAGARDRSFAVRPSIQPRH